MMVRTMIILNSGSTPMNVIIPKAINPISVAPVKGETHLVFRPSEAKVAVQNQAWTNSALRESTAAPPPPALHA